MPEIQTLVTAIVAALIYAIGGYLKQTEKLDYEKLFTTVLLGCAIGIVSWYMGTTHDTATQLLTSAGLIVNIEVWGKAIYRKLKNRIDSS